MCVCGGGAAGCCITSGFIKHWKMTSRTSKQQWVGRTRVWCHLLQFSLLHLQKKNRRKKRKKIFQFDNKMGMHWQVHVLVSETKSSKKQRCTGDTLRWFYQCSTMGGVWKHLVHRQNTDVSEILLTDVAPLLDCLSDDVDPWALVYSTPHSNNITTQSWQF